MHAYIGWLCQTPGCGEEILFEYLGETPILDNTPVTIPTLLFVTCRKCRKTHQYSGLRPQTFLRATRQSVNPKPN
jgi:hypothetical protein